jgi:hypothetical protein
MWRYLECVYLTNITGILKYSFGFILVATKIDVSEYILILGVSILVASNKN